MQANVASIAPAEIIVREEGEFSLQLLYIKKCKQDFILKDSGDLVSQELIFRPLKGISIHLRLWSNVPLVFFRNDC